MVPRMRPETVLQDNVPGDANDSENHLNRNQAVLRLRQDYSEKVRAIHGQR